VNPFLSKKLDHINTELGQLEANVDELTAKLRNEHDRRIEIVKKYWGKGREAAVLSQNAGTYARIAEENERLNRKNQEIRDRLENVLRHTKALAKRFSQ